MRKTLLSSLLLIQLAWNLSVRANTHPLSDSTKSYHAGRLSGAVADELYRNFNGLGLSLPSANVDPIVVSKIPLADSILEKRNQAHALFDKVLSGQRFLQTLDALSEIELPIGVVKSGGALDYTILIDRINFTTRGAMMEVFVSLVLPQSGDRIAFNGKIPLTKEGGIAGIARVNLIGDHHTQISHSSLLTIKATNNTFVEFDCNGFKGVGLDAEVQFSQSLIVPEDKNGNEIKGERVTINFTTYAQSLNDLLIGVSIPPFQINGLKGVGFTVNQAFMDWSDLANPPGLIFPPTYTSPFTGESRNLWQGFYLQRLEVRLPPSFAKRQTDQRISLGVENMILDAQGFTGELFAENVLNAGDMNGWAFTLDRIELALITNQIAGFQLAGKISIPVIKNKDGKPSQFGYVAQRGADGNYIFAVQVKDQLKIDLWAADLKLFTGSSVTIREKDNRFYPSALLHGELTINIDGKGPKASFNSIHFERMIISSEAPYFTPGNFGFGREGQSSSVSKYPVSFSNILVRSESNRVGLGFDLTVNIGGKSSDEGFGGTASLVVWAKQESDQIKDAEGQTIGSARDNWKFHKVELSGVSIKIKKPEAYEFEGRIDFFDADPVYGDGFKGSVKGSISKFGGVQADALFGRTPEFRYWFADALVTLETPGVPLMPGVLFATGFGGGFYSNMKQSAAPLSSALGKTQSGLNYVPDQNSIGIRAIMNISTARPEAVNGNVALEVSMNKNGGINSVTFTGNANFMNFAALAEGKIKELASAAATGNLSENLSALLKGQVYGSIVLQFDNVNDVFHGNLEVFINVAAGIVRGIGSGNRAGWAVLHFERKDWYVLIGTPDQPIGLEVARLFKAKSYFMLGKHLPGSPPPPPQVSEILGDVNLDYMRDFNALESGMGFAFGLHFIVDTGDLKFLMFYGRFAAGTGVDFMLKDYGEDYHCAGSPGKMGINGWYANGQAYAFVMGKIGIKVNLKFYKGNFDILSIGAAAILQTKGPNPFWMKGIVGGHYTIMGGMVKGKCKFEVTVGKDCKPVGNQNVLEDVNIIAEISPAAASHEVNVFNTPQIAFNIPIGEIFEITDKESKLHFFRANLDEFYILDGSQRLSGKLEWNTEKDVVVFDAFDLLPGEKDLKAKARLTFEEKVNGRWVKVKFEGKIVEELAETNFTTAKAPDYIPPNNVSITYPIAGQLNFYPKEYHQGFIQLKDGQPYLFVPDLKWDQKIRMTDQSTQQYVESALTYDQSARRISFTIPAGFNNGKIYRFEILSLPRQKTVIDANVQKIQKELNTEDAGTATLTTKTIEGESDKFEVKSIYSSSFRTSKYDTFVEKMRTISLGQTFRQNLGSNIYQLRARLMGEESFDEMEFNGRLIQVEAILAKNSWYENNAHPIVYEGYPLLGWMKVRRPTDISGVPPAKDIFFEGFRPNPITENQVNVTAKGFTGEFITYNVGAPVASDFYDLRNHAANYLANNPSKLTPRLEVLMLKPMPRILYGPYHLRLSYIIPGTDKVNSSYELEMFNRIPD
jgi:hypothetical protein